MDVPRNEYPRPQFVRSDWLCLNGPWQFEIDAGDSGADTGHLTEIADFVQAIQEGRSTRSNIYESYKSMVLYEAIRDSAETGEVVKVSYEAL